MGRRTILLIAAIIVAAVGTTMIFVYVNGINDRAVADQQPVEVLVAKTTIPSGTTAADAAKSGAFDLQKVAKKQVAPGALSDIEPISNEVALAPVFAGQQILSQMFGAQGSASSLPLPGSKLAISVQLNDPARVAGFVQPGSNVAIFASLTPTGGTGNGRTDNHDSADKHQFVDRRDEHRTNLARDPDDCCVTNRRGKSDLRPGQRRPVLRPAERPVNRQPWCGHRRTQSFRLRTGNGTHARHRQP
jgi:Flp pilus assembly protein CpaB